MFVLLTVVVDDRQAARRLFNADLVSEIRPYSGAEGTFRAAAKSEVVLRNGSVLHVRETLAELAAVLQVVDPRNPPPPEPPPVRGGTQ